MALIDKIKKKQSSINSCSQITVAFLGDSVTHGCFELYPIEPGGVTDAYDLDAVYHSKFKRIMNYLYPTVPFNIINGGISGDTACGGKQRLNRDILSHNPDLTVVCYGLNDSGGGKEGIENYVSSLKEIFEKVRESGSSIMFMTPSVMASRVNARISDPKIRELAMAMCGKERDEIMTMYVDSARELCRSMDVPVCDCYKLWKTMENAGVDTVDLLSNDINHPTKEMHWLFAYELVKAILEGRV